MAKKKKKRRVGLIIFIVFLVLILLPPALVFALFYDPSTKEVHFNEDVEITEIANNAFIDSMDNTAVANEQSRHQLVVDLSSQDLNDLLHSALKKLPEGTDQYLKNFYIDVDGMNYDFHVEAQAYFFKTTAVIQTKLEDTGHDAVFNIKNIKLGRVGKLDSFAASIAKNFIDNNTINDYLKSSGLHMTCNLEKREIRYPKKQLIDDVMALTMKDFASDNSLFYVLFDSMFNNEMEYGFHTDNSLGVFVNLDEYHTNDTLCTPEQYGNDYTTQMNSCKTTISNWIVNENVPVTDIDSAFSYLVKGYAKCSDDAKDGVDNRWNLPSDWCGGVPQAYLGIGIPTGQTIEDMMVNSINTKTTEEITTGDLCLLYEDQINAYLNTQDIIGTSYLLHRKVDGGYKVNYVTLDNFYCNLIDDHAIFVVGISFNGFETVIVFDTRVFSTSDKKLVFKAENNCAYFGEKSISDDLIKYLFKVFKESAENEVMKINEQEREIVFDFGNVIESSSIDPMLKLVIDNASGLELTATSGTTNNSINDRGYIRLKLTL